MRSEKGGAFTFVLHSHLPYCRRAGRWPHGEEWIHEAATETYIPLLIALFDLVENGVQPRITLGMTPILTEQLADPLVIDHLRLFLQEKIKAATLDVERFDPKKDRQQHDLASYFANWFSSIRESLDNRFHGDLVGAFRQLQDAGAIEIITSAATHGYLPLLSRDSSIYAQLRVGVNSYTRHFGRRPRAIWLPECAYRPAFFIEGADGPYLKPGIESFLAEQGLKLFFCETHAIEGGQPIGKARDEVIGPYGEIPKRFVVPITDYVEPTLKTTYRSYYVGGLEVAVLGRNNRTSMQVWSADMGYPGDGDYREFHKKDGISGMQYWRVTGPRLDLAHKDLYHPDWAEFKVQQHAGHFVGLVEQLLSEFSEQHPEDYGIIASNYDTELFGHWWFEGVSWLKEVIQRVSQSTHVRLMTASDYLEHHPPKDILALPESSWGAGGNHFTWDNPDSRWMWPLIHNAEKRMESLVERFPHPRSEAESTMLNQAARELLLLQSSDWPFLVTTGQARSYAIERFGSHLERFEELAGLLEAGEVGPAGQILAARYYELDNPFPDVDYRDFGRRERG